MGMFGSSLRANLNKLWGFSVDQFADADTEIYPLEVPQYHVRLKAR